MAERAFIGLGSNLGDRLANLQRAADILRGSKGIRVARSSRIYETDPVGGPPQPDYLNAVLEVETELDPLDLLAACNEVERALERVRGERWGPRSIDVDVLTFDDRAIEDPRLTVPHPRMHERAFVLLPLLELDADPMLPGGLRAADAKPRGDVRPFAPPLRTSP